MQELWARLLAGEISSPNTYSLRTIEVLRNMNSKDAELFEKICSFSIIYNGIYFLPNYKNYLMKCGIGFDEILHLGEIGLLVDNSMLELTSKTWTDSSGVIINNAFFLSHRSIDSSVKKFAIKQFKFTTIGTEIASLKELGTTEESILSFSKEVKAANKKVSFELFRTIKVIDSISVIHDDFNLLQ